MQEDEFYKKVLDNLYDGVYFADCERQITYWNHGAERITGYPQNGVIGKHCSDNLLMHVDQEGVVLCFTKFPLAETLSDGKTREADVFLHHANGHRVPVTVKVAPIRDEHNEIVGAVEIFSNNSSRQAALNKIHELQQAVFKDSLTEIGNRRFSELRLQTVLSESQQFHIPFGVLFIDVDEFKGVNDQHGHEIGDQVLRMVANTLNLNVHATDFVGRWGGDEFLVLLQNVDIDQLNSIANKLRFLVQHSCLNVDPSYTNISVTISSGGTITQAGDTVESIMERVDRLLYDSKADGRNRVTIE